jgi:DNA-binding response OmpR family regulator
MDGEAQGAKRFLVVEDEVVIAMLLEDYLSDVGCTVAWHAQNLDEALRLAKTTKGIDGAILDMNLNGLAIDPVASVLAQRRIPFCFMTGYGSGAVTGFPEAPTISKPFDADAIMAVVTKLTGGAG